MESFLNLKHDAHEVYEWARQFDPKLGLTEELALCLDPVQKTHGRGSVLFRCIETRNVDLVRCFLLHPRAAEVVNGTGDSWPPFELCMTMGHVEMAELVQEHPAFKLDYVPWQFEFFVLREAQCFTAHPDLDQDVPYDRIKACVRRFFERRAAAGHAHPTFDEYFSFVCSDDSRRKAKKDAFMEEFGVYFHPDYERL